MFPIIRCRNCLLTLLLFLLAVGGAKAQPEVTRTDKWTGNLELITGLGISHLENDGKVADTLVHIKEQANLSISRATSAFSFSTQAQGFFEKNMTYTRRATIRGRTRTELLVRASEIIQPGSNIRSDFGWRPSNGQQIDAYVTYKFDFNRTKMVALNLLLDSLENFNYNSAFEDSKTQQHAATAGWKSSHQLGSPRRQLLTSGEWKGTFDREASDWAKMMFYMTDNPQLDSSNSIGYRLTPQLNEHEGALYVSYRDSLIKGIHNLTIEPGAQARLSRTLNNNSGLVHDSGGTWRDSTGLHEDFDYFTVLLEPRLQLEYRYSTFRLSADYSLQFYGSQLSSQLHYQPMEWERPAVVGRSFAEWAPGAGHKLTLGSSLSLTRPGYFQLCWYDRQGSDPSQLIRGNPDLQRSRSISTDLTWNFNVGGFRLTTISIYDYKIGDIEQLFINQMIDGQVYRIFTWVNSAYGHSFTQRLQAGWRGKFLSANVQGNYQHNALMNADSDEMENFNNWEVRADITARTTNGWSFSTNGFYRSDSQSLYSRKKNVYTINTRIAKEFKHITIYLDGRDLLDHPVTVTYFSQNKSEQWEETTIMNRCMVLLGFIWSF